MNLIRFRPDRDIDNFFDRFYRPFGHELGMQSMARTDWMPSVDISETDDEYLIKVEIPEVEKEDVNLKIENGMLSISGERRYTEEDARHHRVERYYGSFQRKFSLPEGVDEDDIAAEQKDGMLYIHLHKPELGELPDDNRGVDIPIN